MGLVPGGDAAVREEAEGHTRARDDGGEGERERVGRAGEDAAEVRLQECSRWHWQEAGKLASEQNSGAVKAQARRRVGRAVGTTTSKR